MVKRTYNPIKREEAYQNGLMPKIPIPEPKCAIVLIARREGSRTKVITNESRIKASDIRKGKYDYLAEIDMHQNNIQIEIKAMSRDQVSDFTITLSGIAVVTEPDIIYREQIKDVAQHIENGVMTELQSMAADFDISEWDYLKRDIEEKFGAHVYIDSGISVNSISVLVKSDENYGRLLEEKRKIRYQRELDKDKSEAAEEAKQRFRDHGTASYKEYIDGNMSAAEANAQWREEQEKTFDMQMRQAQGFIQVGEQLENTDWVDKDQIARRAEEVLQGFTLGGGSSNSGNRIGMKGNGMDDSDIFREIEGDDGNG